MKENNKQIRYNFYSNVLALIVNVIIGILYVPYLIKYLGLVAYGIVPLALVINQYISVFTLSFTSSLTRFYSVSIHKGDLENASRNISTAIVIVLLLSVICFILMFIIISKIDQIFSISEKFLISAKVLFAFSIMSISLSMFSSVLNVTIYALNRLDLLNIIKTSRILLKFVFVIFFFIYVEKDIKFVGISNFLAELSILLLSISFFNYFSGKNIKLSFKLFNKTVFIAIFVMTTWVIVHQIGDVGIYRIDIIVVNKIWGQEYSGALGAISEFFSYVLLVVSLISSLFGPIILIAYSKGDHYKVIEIAKSRSYISGILAAILGGTIAGFSISILNVWLGENYVQYNVWLSLKMISLPFYAAGGVLAFVYRAWCKVKKPALITLILGFLNISIIVTISFFQCNILNIKIILLFCTLFAIIQSYFMNAFFVNMIYNKTFTYFIVSSLKFSFIFAFSFVFGKIAEKTFYPSNIIELFIMLVLSIFILFGVAYMFLFSHNHKKQIKEIIK